MKPSNLGTIKGKDIGALGEKKHSDRYDITPTVLTIISSSSSGEDDSKTDTRIVSHHIILSLPSSSALEPFLALGELKLTH